MPRNKLTLKQVQEVLTVKAHKSARSLAKEYGVAHSTISYIRQGRTWKNEILMLKEMNIDLTKE